MSRTTESGPAEPLSPQRAHQDGLNVAMRVLSYLIAGVGLYGFLGWLGDRLLGTAFLLPVGILLGAGLGVYVIIRYLGTRSDLTAPVPTGTKEGTR